MIPGRPPASNVLVKLYLPPEIHEMTSVQNVMAAFSIINQRIQTEKTKEVFGELRRCVGDNSGEEERSYTFERQNYNEMVLFAQKHNFGISELASLLAWYSFNGDNQS